MSKWKIFNWSMEKKISAETENRTQNLDEYEKKSITHKIKEESEDKPIKEFNETLYSSGFIEKKKVIPPEEQKQTLKRSSWENLRTIEHNVDEIKDEKKDKRETKKQKNDISQKVDRILYKKNFR